MYHINLAGKTAWVTGASRGIGRASALALAEAGCNVAISYRTQEVAAADVANKIFKLGRTCTLVQVDVADPLSCKAAHAHIEHKLGPVDILVNNAGMIQDNLFLLLEPKDWQSVLQTNVLGPVHVTQTVLRDMMMHRWGRIINITSAAGKKGGRGQANYAASKGAVEAMSRSLAVEVGGKGITVNCLAPGVTETDMSKDVIRLAKEQILDRQIIKRFASPDEIAAWVVFLASEQASFVTGQTIAIDGGLKMV